VLQEIQFTMAVDSAWVLHGAVLHAVADGVYEKDKERLANMMAFGQDITPASETSKVVGRRQQKLEVDSDEETDRFQER